MWELKRNNALTIRTAKRMSAICMLTTLGLTYKVWLPADAIQHIPVINKITVASSVHWILFIGIVMSLVYVLISPKGTIPGLAVMVLVLTSVMFDLNRCQVWLLHFLFILLLPQRADEKEAIIAITFMISVTYIFSGLHKFNIGFVQETLPWLCEPFGFSADKQLLGLVIPLVEILIGLFLWLPRRSALFNVCGIIVHSMIIYIILYHKWNYSVLPWNAMLILFHGVLAIGGGIKLNGLPRINPQMFCFLFIVTMAFAGYIPRFLSFQLYSGNQFSGIVVFSDASFKRLPTEVIAIAQQLKSTKEPFLNLDRYAMQQLGVPLYQSIESYRVAAKSFILFTRDDNDLVLLVRNGPQFIFEKDLWAFTLAELKQ